MKQFSCGGGGPFRHPWLGAMFGASGAKTNARNWNAVLALRTAVSLVTECKRNRKQTNKVSSYVLTAVLALPQCQQKKVNRNR